MAKDNRIISLILGCQLFKPSFYLNKLRKSNFDANQYDSKIIDTSIDFLNISMIHCYGCYDKKNNCLIYNFMYSDY
jgi:hypothetical protein